MRRHTLGLLTMAGFVIVILIPTWQAEIPGSVLFLWWTTISLPGTMKLVSAVVPKEKRTMGIQFHSQVRRVLTTP